MIRSVLRLTRLPVFTECCSLGDAGVSPAFARLEVISRNICTSSRCNKEIRMANEKVKVGKKSKHGILEGEISALDMSMKQDNLFPDAETPNRLFNGIPYKQLHIVNIKATQNNTIMTVTDYNGRVLSLHSAGVEGFKNARKGTNIAAQQAAITFGNRLHEYGINTIKLRVQGIGAGRLAAIKGLQMTGLNIVSITDDTRVSWNPPRPRKQRRI